MGTTARTLVTVFVVLFPSVLAFGAININTEAVQKSVVFLYAGQPDGGVNKNAALGTGFLISVPLLSDPKRSYVMLVTARHVLDPSWAKCPVLSNPSVIYMRLNKKDYSPSSTEVGFDFVPIPLIERGQQKWLHLPAEDIDAAVVPLPIDLSDRFDLAEISLENFPTDKELEAQSIGDQVMSAGLMPALPGIKRNYPIFKFGQISNIPKEDIETRCVPQPQQPTFFVKVWLIAANLISGNSGSPIYHVPFGGNGISIGGTRPMLLGVQSISFGGADVAGMTPINFVYEIIEKMALPDADLRRGPKPAPTAPPQRQ